MSVLQLISRSAAAAVATTLLAAIPTLAVAQDSVSAVWVPKQVQFIYQGFTTHYSCDGLRDQVRDMLQKLGARDLKVREYGCARAVGPDPFPGVSVSMRVLVPASSTASSAAKSVGAPVDAQWKDVVLLGANSSFEDQGNCELIEQFKETFLPLFATRNVKYGSTCVPHQLSLGTHLSAQVLMPPAKVATGGQ